MARRLNQWIDPFVVAMIVVIVIASAFPASGPVAAGFSTASTLAIGLLFLLYGARLSLRQTLDGLVRWRLHVAVLCVTFVVFPVIGVALQVLTPGVLSDEVYRGVLYLTLVPSTVQSSIAFTSMARGNVPGAMVSASLSNLVGVVLTPVLVMALMSTSGDAPPLSVDSIGRIAGMILAPFVVGQLMHRWAGGWLSAHQAPTKVVERGSILLVIYAAFSAGMAEHLWSRISVAEIVMVAVLSATILFIVMAGTWWLSARLGFARGDRIALMFCGSKKSLASGMPMATVLFAGSGVGIVILPLMVFHQIQLVVCGIVAPRLARNEKAPEPGAGSLA